MNPVPPKTTFALRTQIAQAGISQKDRLMLYALALIADKLDKIANKP